MIKTIKSLQEEIEKFNSQNKYITTCEYCKHQIIYTKDKLQNNIIKCPYCGHTQKILFDNNYNVKLRFAKSLDIDDDSYRV